MLTRHGVISGGDGANAFVCRASIASSAT